MRPMTMPSTPKMGPRETPRIPNVSKSRKVKRPSEALQERMAEEDQNKSLSEKLSDVAMAMPPGEGMISKALKAALSGAAAGATIGEALSKLHQEKIQSGKPQTPNTMSGMSMSGGDYGKKRKLRK